MTDRYFDLLYWMVGLVGLGFAAAVAIVLVTAAVACIPDPKPTRPRAPLPKDTKWADFDD